MSRIDQMYRVQMGYRFSEIKLQKALYPRAMNPGDSVRNSCNYLSENLYMLRSALVSAGNASARRPEDYFRITQPRDQAAPPQRRRPSLMHQCKEAVEALDKALNLPPRQLGKEVDQVENMMVQMRDRLIEQLRQDGSSAAAAQWRTALEHLNAALSLVTGVEYPAAGIQRSSLEEARDVLVQMLEDHLLT